jgi:hypothetical protein
MNITLIVGLFFLVLAVVFALLALSQGTPAAKARRRIAVIFAIVGFGLVVSRLLRG